MPKNMNKTIDQYSHYQEYFNNFLGAWSFKNGDEVLTITGVREEEMFDAQTGGKKKGLCVYVAEKELPMVLNKTNATMIAEVTGTDVLGEWIGKRICVGTERVKAFGKVSEAIRVRDRVPEPVKAAEPATEAQMERIRALISDGVINEPALCKYLRISDISGISRTQARDAIERKTGEVIE
jgi:hypothetical protein